MDQIRTAADSSCDLLTMNGVDFVSVPLTVRTAVEEFRDDAALNVDAMVTTLRGTKGRTFSACPNIADWESAFGESGQLPNKRSNLFSMDCFVSIDARTRCAPKGDDEKTRSLRVKRSNPHKRNFIILDCFDL